MVAHGGNLFSIAKKYNSDPKTWLDLSTGVSPFVYPVPAVPQSCWHHLPQNEDGLHNAASFYYLKYIADECLLPVSGSQAAIMALPRLLLTHVNTEKGIILLPRVGYKEHEKAWIEACNEWNIRFEFYDLEPTPEQLARTLILLVINVNNPTGHIVPKRRLEAWHLALKERGGYLVVDEAFIDLIEDSSLLPHRKCFSNLVVLRSVGKFFGLAGLRVGFVFLEPRLKNVLESSLGPWTLTGASRYIACCALNDSAWQVQQRERIQDIATDMKRVLVKHFSPNRVVEAPLFFRVEISDAVALFEQLCQHRVLVRLCDEHDALRFGLVADKEALARLDKVLADVC